MLRSMEVGVIVTHSLSRHSNTTDLSLSPLKHPLEMKYIQDKFLTSARLKSQKPSQIMIDFTV